MTSRPDVTYNANGEVVMVVDNGVTVYLRLSPEVAREVGRKFLLMADGAAKIRADMATSKDPQWHEVKDHTVYFGKTAESEKDGLD